MRIPWIQSMSLVIGIQRLQTFLWGICCRAADGSGCANANARKDRLFCAYI